MNRVLFLIIFMLAQSATLPKTTTLQKTSLIGKSSGVNTFTFVQAPAASSCVTPCTISISATGSGHLLFLQAGDDNLGQAQLSAVTCTTTCGTWTIGTAGSTCLISDGNQALSCAYILSSTSGATTVNITLTNSDSTLVRFWEYSYSPGPAILDTSGRAFNGTAGTSQTGPALTLGGTSDLVFQNIVSSANINAINAPYGRFDATGGHMGTADNENTSSGVAGVWTLSASATAVSTAVAFK